MYSVYLYDENTEDIYKFRIPTLPYKGLKIVLKDVWEIVDMQIDIHMPGSQSYRDNSPIPVNAIVKKINGIFKY